MTTVAFEDVYVNVFIDVIHPKITSTDTACCRLTVGSPG